MASTDQLERATTGFDPATTSELAQVLGRKWTPTILDALWPAPQRHGQLCRKLRGIHGKVIRENLDLLMAEGFVEKLVGIDDVGAAYAAYSLTPLARSLEPVLAAMQGWCELHLDKVRTSKLNGTPAVRVATSRPL